MATGSESLFSIRGALGATEGAATTPTRLLYIGGAQNVDLSGIQKFETIEDRRAWARAVDLVDTFAGIENNTFSLSNVPVSYQDIGWWLATIPGIDSSSTGEGANTPTTTDTSAYTRTYLVTPANTEWGTTGGYDAHLQFAYSDLLSTVGWSLPGLRCTSMSLTWNKRASGTDTGLLMSGTWTTPKTCTQITSFTGSLSDRTQSWALGNTLTAHIDPTTGDLGTTADTNVMSATWNWSRQAVFHDGMDNTGLHTSMHFPGHEATTLQITRKFSNTTELTAYKARTRRAIRLQATGALVGASTAYNTVRLDTALAYMDHTETRMDGLIYATLDFAGRDDSTLGGAWRIVTINNVSAAYTAA